MNCQENINSALPTQLPGEFSYIVAILGHNHFESPNILQSTTKNAYWIPKKIRTPVYEFSQIQKYVQLGHS
jgi:hypothetical protein